MKVIKFVIATLLASALVWALNTSHGQVPALGSLLSPFQGFWQNGETGVLLPNNTLKLEGLTDEVTVQYDDNHVPHIFANNDHDLYYAQGYVQAQDRLWQMDFVTRAAGGRLSEVVGDKALDLDRYKRRMGSVYAAENSLKSMVANPINKVSVDAYTAGINAYIKQLKPQNYPLEFKLLGYAPEDWTPLKCALLLKEMSFTLASGTDDFRMSNTMNKLGTDLMTELFPDFPQLESPIIPNGTKIDFTPLPVKNPSTSAFKGNIAARIAPERDPAIGSNNWAVHGSRTNTGLPILSGDPHLSLSLPSIWYQIQLTAPGINACGVTLPGSPGVVIGFNENIAWSQTNVGSDVVDWYQIKFKDKSQNEYWHDNQWKKTTKRLEKISIKGKEAVTDTVVYTHHGPVVYQEGEKPFLQKGSRMSGIPLGHAVRWIAHESTDELASLYALNRANNYDEYVKALAPYGCPAQNFVFASNQNDVAIWVNGKFPLKWKEQGKYILDGTNASHDWQGWIPQAQNPHVKNPARGFVSSANQFSVNPKDYPYYLHWQFANANRSRRINERLEKMTMANIDSMRLLQFDNLNIDARTFMPMLVKNLKINELSAVQQAALKLLTTWDYHNEVGQIAPTIFEAWMPNIVEGTWADELAMNDTLPVRRPSEYRTMAMIDQQPTAKWFDDVNTKDKTETLSDVLQQSFKAAIDTLIKKNGPISPKWEWQNVKNTSVGHLAMLKAFSRENIQTGGGARIVNATTGKTGPSWRMLVELHKDGPKAYGLYPGGQSGNPGNPFYDNMIAKWAKGELNELVFLKKKDDKNTRIVSSLKMSK